MQIKTNTRLINAILLSIFSLAILSVNFNVSAEEKTFLTTRVLSAKLALQAATAAYDDCSKKGYQVSAAVVDRSGALLAFIRNPLSGAHTIKVSQRKAYSAATYQTPTSEMMDREPFRFTPGVLLLGGALPIRVAGHFYGAIAVSGAPPRKVPGDIDDECSQVGLDTITEILEFAD